MFLDISSKIISAPFVSFALFVIEQDCYTGNSKPFAAGDDLVSKRTRLKLWGCFVSTDTGRIMNRRYPSTEWKTNCHEDRRIGTMATPGEMNGNNLDAFIMVLIAVYYLLRQSIYKYYSPNKYSKIVIILIVPLLEYDIWKNVAKNLS